MNIDRVLVNGVERYVYEGESVKEYPEQKAVIILSEKVGKFCARGYSGKKSKADFNYYYRSEIDRDKSIQKYLEGLQSRIDAKKADRAKKAEFQTTLEVGDILEGSWGYDQTNIEFYQVVKKISGKSIEIRELCQSIVEGSTGFLCENVMPVKDCFTENSKPIRKLVNVHNRVSFQCFSLSKWDGRACYQSHYA